MPSVSICTYSKGRIDHVRETIPLLLKSLSDDDEIIYVDYSCPENSGEYVKSLNDSRIKTVMCKNNSIWHMNHARNIAGIHASKSILVFMDIDVYLKKNNIDEIKKTPRGQYMKHPGGKNLYGFLACYREDFLKVNGYEEGICGYGWDDISMLSSLDNIGLWKREMTTDVDTIDHDSNRSTSFHDVYNKEYHDLNEKTYNHFKKFHKYKNNVNRNWGKGVFKKKKSFSFYTACMGRSEHIKKTLINNIENNIGYGDVEFVLLNYNSRDDLHEWVLGNCERYIKSGILKYCITREPKKFHMSHAKNLSAMCCSNEFLISLDADRFLSKNFCFNLNNVLYGNMIYCPTPGVDGFIGVNKKHFYCIKGYDENMKYWGPEDADFRDRILRKFNCINVCDYIQDITIDERIVHDEQSRICNIEMNGLDYQEAILVVKEQKEENDKNNIIIANNGSFAECNDLEIFSWKT